MLRFLLGLFLSLLMFANAWSSDYVIGDGDTLVVSVWSVPELSGNVVVRPDGKITLPAVGDVAASGLTPKELSQHLTKVLESYVKTPIVTVAVSAITNNRIYVSGGGVPSKVINLTGRTTLFKLLCSLEKIENADLQRASLVRDGKKLSVDFYDLFVNGQVNRDVSLEPEDIIYLPNNDYNKIYVVGAVTTPQAITYRKGLRILDAIFGCGGFTKYAKQSAVLIMRKSDDGGMQQLIVNIEELMKDGDLSQNLELARGDYVVVKEGIF